MTQTASVAACDLRPGDVVLSRRGQVIRVVYSLRFEDERSAGTHRQWVSVRWVAGGRALRRAERLFIVREPRPPARPYDR